ncbi:MAG: M20/M25/M40 family metallo-hydrolase, partial [Rhizobiales bacterium]|nr:M20/M25/M40 family metallo-hydrolase [Hyphomicrobiales bacterium]
EVGTGQSRVTIGAVELRPNHPHTIPGEAVFSLIGRDGDAAVMGRLAERLRAGLHAVAGEAGLGLAIAEQSWLDPAPCDGDIVAAFRRQAGRLGLRYRVMQSGAGHDTQFMAALTRAGMIFVPSIGGISHAPEEDTRWPDVEAGANLLLHTLLDVAGRAD